MKKNAIKKHQVFETPHSAKCPHCNKTLHYLLMEDMPFMDGKAHPKHPKDKIGGCIDEGHVLICPKCHRILKVGFNTTDKLSDIIYRLRAIAAGKKLAMWDRDA